MRHVSFIPAKFCRVRHYIGRAWLVDKTHVSHERFPRPSGPTDQFPTYLASEANFRLSDGSRMPYLVKCA